MLGLVEWWRTRKIEKDFIMKKQRNPNEIAHMNVLLFRGPEGDIRFKTRIRGEFKIDGENATVVAIQELIKKLEEESKTNKWSAMFKHPKRRESNM